MSRKTFATTIGALRGGRRTGGRAVEPVGPGRAGGRSHGAPARSVPPRSTGSGARTATSSRRRPSAATWWSRSTTPTRPVRPSSSRSPGSCTPRAPTAARRSPTPAAPAAARCSTRGSGGAIPHGVGKTYDWYGMDPRGVGASIPALSCDPKFSNSQHRPLPAHDHGDPELLAGQDRGVRRRVRHLGGQGPAAAPEDDRQRGGLRVAAHRDRAGAGDLLRLLLRHLPRRRCGPPCTRLAQGDGARRRRGPRPGLVPGQPRPGPRLRDRLQEVLQVDRQVRPQFHLGRTGRQVGKRYREAAQAAGEEAGPGQARRRPSSRTS